MRLLDLLTHLALQYDAVITIKIDPSVTSTTVTVTWKMPRRRAEEI